MKQLLLFFVTLSMAVFASAQQLPDPGFEDWSGAKFANAEQPKYWNFSNVSQMGVDKNFAHKTTGRSGSALKIQDQRVGVDSIGTTSPGYVSLGKTWAFTSSDTAIEDATAGTYGGVQWKYRPDSMVVWIKRYYDSSAEGADGDHVMDEDFNILYYAWSGTAQGATYKAKNGSCTNVYSAKPEYCIDEESDIRQALNGNECGTKTYAKQIAEGWICDRKVYSDWTRIVVPIYYLNDDVPEKCNVILSAGNYPNFRANIGQYAGSTMDVDDISLVYTSKIQKLYINGREWKEFNPNSTEEQTYSLGLGITEIPDIYAVRGAGSLTNLRNETVNFPGRRLSNTECKIVKGQVDGEPTTITVTSEDGKSTTTYKIKFKSRNTKLADLKVNGTPVHGFNVHLNTFHYNVALPYGTTTIPTVTATAQDANATISITQANSVTGKATVLVTAADGTQQTYTITFFVVALTDVMLYVDGIGALDMNQGPNFTLNFPYGTKELNVSVVKKYEDQEVTILNNGVNEPTTITVKSFNPAEADKVYTITPNVIDYPDYSLTSVTVNGAPLANFNPNILTYIIPVTTTKPVLKYQHTGVVGVSATTLQDNNKYTQVEVIDEYSNTRYYTFYYYYENDIIPNGDFTEYRAGLKNTNHTQMPVGWYGYADQYKDFQKSFWRVDNPGREIFKLKDGVLGITWGFWSELKSSAPLVLTLGSTEGFKYAVNGGSSASFSGGIPFRNTPDAADITYQLVDDEGLKSKFSFVFTDEQNNVVTTDYIASEVTSNYTTHRQPLTTANKVITNLNINIDASNGHKAGTDAGCWANNFCGYGDVIYIDRIAFVYSSALTALTVDGQAATLTDKNFAADFSNSEMLLPSLAFTGEVPDQMPVVTWSNAWTKSGAKATRTATIVNYAEDLSSTTYTLTVTRPTSANANCTYTLNGKDLTIVKGSPHQTIAVTANDTAYVITVTAENGETKIIEVPYNKACVPYTYSVLTSDSTLGSVTITQEPTCTEPLIFRADAAEGYQFTQWSDGNTDNPRTITLTQDTVLKALFEQIIIEQDTIIVADSTGISDIIPDGQDTIPYIEVQPDGEITIDITDVRIGVITIVTIGTESGQVHPGFGGNYDELENTRVVMEYVLNPFGQTASPDKWYAFAVPFEVDIETGITRKYGNKSHTPGVDFMILEYDSELRSCTGSGWKEKKSGLLEPGHFYMLGIEGNCNRWLFEKKRGAAIVGDKEKDLQHYAHGNSKNNGWHGLGNTTLEYVDMSFDGLNATYVYTYDNQYGKYNIFSIEELEELILAVGQPFFTQGDNDGSVVFTPNNGKGKGNGKKNMPIYAPSYDVQPSHPRVLLTIETEKINATPDRLYITLHDDNQCGSYRIGRDFMRMDKGSKVLPNFWCPMADGTQLSAHGVTMPTTYTTIPLGIFTPAKGEYTINAHMQDMDDYIVEIYYQNVCLGTFMHDMPLTLDLTAGTSYEYSIRISRRVSTDLNPAEDTQCDKDNKWYDVLGRPLPQDAHGIFIRKGEKIIK